MSAGAGPTSALLEKSNLNRKAAEFLITTGYPCSSIHCAYYRCFQYLMYLEKTKLPTIQAQVPSAYRRVKGIHEILIRAFTLEIAKKSGPESGRFEADMGNLKGLRKLADYKDTPVPAGKEVEALELCDSVVTRLDSTFT